jgi:hypothetical protein
MIEILTGMNLLCMRNAYCKTVFGVVDGYVRWVNLRNRCAIFQTNVQILEPQQTKSFVFSSIFDLDKFTVTK